MLDFNLYQYSQELEKYIKNKFLFNEFDLHVSENDNSISFIFKNELIKDNAKLVNEILEESLKLLNEKGFRYRHSILHPNPLQISDTTTNPYHPNDSTENYYTLVKIED